MNGEPEVPLKIGKEKWEGERGKPLTPFTFHEARGVIFYFKNFKRKFHLKIPFIESK